MSRKRKNAGEGYGYMFHGAFTKKKDAVEKERTRKGSFIKGMPTAKGYRYVVFTPRTNPIKRKKKSSQNWAVLESGAIRARFAKRKQADSYAKDAQRFTHHAVTVKRVPAAAGGYSDNPMDLLVMGANPGHSSREIVVEPGQTITLRVNPSGQTCGHIIGGLPCTREPGHSGPHLPQGATLRPASRHNWGRRSNPDAESIREEFTGGPVGRVSLYQEGAMPGGDYALLGRLLTLYIRPLAGGQVLKINGRGVQVVSDETARQIWFVGGDQDISAYLGKFGARDCGAGRYELGEAVRIDYKQRKEHLPDPDHDEFKHFFGEENDIRPRVFFDAVHKRLLLEGGDYRIEARGIIN